MPVIRKAQRRDASQLAEVAEAMFRTTFGAVNSPDDMEMHCRSSYGEGIQAREILDPTMETLISDDSGQIVGFAQLRWSKAPACVSEGSAGEIQRLYVATEWHGRGVARSLMDAAIEEMKRRGSKIVWLGVWERNPRAIAFYKKLGLVEVGEHVFHLGRDPQRDIVMQRAI